MFRIYTKDLLAAETFAALAKKMTGGSPSFTDDPEAKEDLVVLGSDASNPFTARLVLEKRLEIPKIRAGSDDYFMQSLEENGRTILILGGGRPRALLYAVYAFFESKGCAYFWDGDVIPHAVSLDISGYSVFESPRFEYRGLRYFAHRSLHRFQAEHWTLDDWKKEIDWILKKRLNLFMLRIGLDDLFQKAFPDIVPYPEDGVPCHPEFERSYNDRTHFWSLEERGKLRKKLLDYAFERDLIHPEDTGTISHWYSHAPDAFVDTVRPSFVPQSSGAHTGKNMLVWDIREDENLDNYFKLTQAHIDNYGSSQMFHTIGLAERDVSADRRINHLWKLFAYRRIIERLRKSFPNSPLLIASWDFINNHWTSDQMHELLDTLDPANTILFDYTSDSDNEVNYFMNWGVYGKFPWIFGIFQAFESGNDLRGNYAAIKRRLALASDDPFCKGMVIWPENSHGDTLMYEYFAANAWRPEFMDIHDFLPRFCAGRYPGREQEMLGLWKSFLPAIECGYWNFHQFYGESFAHLNAAGPETVSFKRASAMKLEADRLRPCLKGCGPALGKLAETDLSGVMVRRDAIDLARTAAARLFQYLYNTLPGYVLEKKDCSGAIELMRGLLSAMTDVLAASPEFSLNHSLTDLRKAGHVNPIFEHTLKCNAENGYCRSFIYELCEACYKPEFEAFVRFLETGVRDEAEIKRIQDAFYADPLEKYCPDCVKASAALPKAFARLAELAEKAESYS